MSKKSIDSAEVKKTVTAVGASSRQISSFTSEAPKKVSTTGKTIIESENAINTLNFIGKSTKEVITESRKIASKIIFNVSMVALIFIVLNTIFFIFV